MHRMNYNTPNIVFVGESFWEGVNYLTKLLGIQGYRITGLRLEKRKGRESIVLEIKRERAIYRCGKYGKGFKSYHSSWFIEVRHLMLWQYPTFLKVRRYRVKCPQCGITTEPIEFIAKGVR